MQHLPYGRRAMPYAILSAVFADSEDARRRTEHTGGASTHRTAGPLTD